MYHVLRTIAEDGSNLTHLSAADRIVMSGENYLSMLAEAKNLRRAIYRHKVTGEEREYSALETDGCAHHEDQAVWNFLCRASLVRSLGYALAVEDIHLPMYEPKAVSA